MDHIDSSLSHSQEQKAGGVSNEHVKTSLAVLIVTFNSQQDLIQNLHFLSRQTQLPDLVLVIDCASSNRGYLDEVVSMQWPFALRVERLDTNYGYAGGNNIGLRQLAQQHINYVLILNPDAFLVAPNCIEMLLAAAQKISQPHLIAPLLMHFDRNSNRLSGLVDSAGLKQNAWGRWFDRLHGQPLSHQTSAVPECVAGLCGAALLIPVSLIHLLQQQRQGVFDSSFFMYKEDIELGCYLNKIEVNQYLIWGVSVGHCRGWNKLRQNTSRWARILSAKNDMRVAWRYRWLSIPFAIAKFLAVKLFNM